MIALKSIMLVLSVLAATTLVGSAMVEPTDCSYLPNNCDITASNNLLVGGMSWPEMLWSLFQFNSKVFNGRIYDVRG